MKKHITALDGLRGIAILLVLATHLLPHRSAGSALLRMLNAVAGVGWSGVDIFFTLSGFLITGILYESKRDDSFFINFYMRRTLRIVPLYVLLVTCCILIFPHFAATQGSAPAKHQWMFWTYLSNILVTLYGAVSVGWLGPLWSLAVEEHFYIVWPAIIFFLSRKNAMKVCVACILLANGTRLWFIAHHNLLGAYVFTLSRFDELALGGLVALALRGEGAIQNLQLIGKRAVVVFGLVTATVLSWRHGVILDPITLGVGVSATGAVSAAALMLAVLPDTAKPWKALLQVSVLRQFGRYSYGLYMLHMPVWEWMHQHRWIVRGEGRGADLANFTLAIAISFAVAFLSFHLIESHFLRLKRFFEARQTFRDSQATSRFSHDDRISDFPVQARL